MKLSSTIGLSDLIRDTNWRKVSTAVVASSASLFTLFAITGTAGIRINATPSLPIGLYIKADASSKFIEFCPVGPSAWLAANRGYRTAGDCPDGASALLKPIIAKAGDIVEVTAEGISVNAHFVQNTAPLSMDTKHRPLDHFPYGRYIVAREEVWVASSYNSLSFDSRYYGPVPIYRIREHLKPLLTL